MTLTAVLLGALAAHADSPLTSIDLTASYAGLPAVREAKQGGRASPAVLEFLLSRAPNDQKAAVVNALGWEGNDNASAFLEAVAKAHHLDLEKLGLKDLAPSDCFVAGYLRAMDDYLDLKPIRPPKPGSPRTVWTSRPLEILTAAASALPDDFTVQFVRAMVQAQLTIAKEERWCEVFTGPQKVLEQFPPPRRNLKPGAVEAAMGYLAAYEESCPKSKVATLKKREELNQIYELAKLGPQIVAGTQGGIVVWNPEAREPVAVQEEFICNHVVVWEGSAWVGCDKNVFRWNGTSFKSYLTNSANDAEYYAPMLGPHGQLWVRYAAKTYAFEPQGDRFVEMIAPWKGSPYDALVTRSGEVWWIDFLNSVHSTRRTLRLKSAEYPGSDPRHFREDASGALWVEDFESGFFRLEPDGNFVRVPGVDRQAAGVAFELKHERLFLLQYRQGLVITRSGHTLKTVDLTDLEFMRDLLLDPEGDVWVAGWNRLLRLREDGGDWTKRVYRIEPRQ